MAVIKNIAPSEIENQSFAIIEREFLDQTGIDPSDVEPAKFQIIRRVIHATGDFGFARSLIFHENSIDTALSAIKAGRDIYIDVSMGASGISKSILNGFGGTVRCYINDSDVADRARQEGKTKTETALEKLSSTDAGIVAVGNAPTALIAAMKLIDAGKLNPGLVIGIPVGFVNAAESKELLSTKTYPFITNKGRKGGSPVAVAIVNALLRLAQQQYDHD